MVLGKGERWSERSRGQGRVETDTEAHAATNDRHRLIMWRPDTLRVIRRCGPEAGEPCYFHR